MVHRKEGIKTGGAKSSSAARRLVFVERYLTNGNNGSEAAQFAGYGARNARSHAHKILGMPEIQAIVAARMQRVVESAQLSTERWAKDMAAIGHVDPGELYDADGNLIPLHKLPEHVRRAIASVDIEQRTEGRGEDQQLITTTKLKLWDKNSALLNIGKHLGVFEKDNAQNTPNIRVLVQLMG